MYRKNSDLQKATNIRIQQLSSIKAVAMSTLLASRSQTGNNCLVRAAMRDMARQLPRYFSPDDRSASFKSYKKVRDPVLSGGNIQPKRCTSSTL